MRSEDDLMARFQRLLESAPDDEEAVVKMFLEMKRLGWKPDFVGVENMRSAPGLFGGYYENDEPLFNMKAPDGWTADGLGVTWIAPIEATLKGDEPPQSWDTGGVAIVTKGGLLEKGWLVIDGVPKVPFDGVCSLCQVTDYEGELELDEKVAYAWLQEHGGWVQFWDYERELPLVDDMRFQF